MSEFASKDVMDTFASRHYAVHGRNKLALRNPLTQEGLDFYEAWRQVFVRKGVTKDEADRASAYILANPPKQPADHFAALLGAIETERKSVRAEQDARHCHVRFREDMKLAERQDRLLAAFRRLPEAERQAWIDGVTAETPSLTQFGDWAERVASDAWVLSVGTWDEPSDQSAA